MSRAEFKGEKYSIAFGVDRLRTIGAFVQVWDHTEEAMPYNEGEEGSTNIVVNESNLTLGGQHLTEERVIQLAGQYAIPINIGQLYEIFD